MTTPFKKQAIDKPPIQPEEWEKEFDEEFEEAEVVRVENGGIPFQLRVDYKHINGRLKKFISKTIASERKRILEGIENEAFNTDDYLKFTVAQWRKLKKELL